MRINHAPIELYIGPYEKTQVRYDLADRAIRTYHASLLDLIARTGATDVCDVGGGANPELSHTEIRDMKLNYTVLDISAEEVKKAGPGYSVLVADAGASAPPKKGAFDLVFSRMLAEHIADGAAFHRNVFVMLRPGGIAFHFFPTLYALPYVINWLMPEELALRLLVTFDRKRDLHGREIKFPAYYSWCRGPLSSQIRRLESIGFCVLDYIGFFGHNGYYKRFPPLLYMHKRISKLLLQWEVPWQTSLSYVVLRRPTDSPPYNMEKAYPSGSGAAHMRGGLEPFSPRHRQRC